MYSSVYVRDQDKSEKGQERANSLQMTTSLSWVFCWFRRNVFIIKYSEKEADKSDQFIVNLWIALAIIKKLKNNTAYYYFFFVFFFFSSSSSFFWAGSKRAKQLWWRKFSLPTLLTCSVFLELWKKSKPLTSCILTR